jgi:acyl transferase domain-containing protein
MKRVLVVAPGRGGGIAAEAIFSGSFADFDAIREKVEIAGFVGNSLGFYTTLALSGALSKEDGARLVATNARLQAELNPGKQLIYPWVDEEWRPVAERRAAIVSAIESGAALDSIRLGGFAVLACEDPKRVVLPPVRQGGRDYPFVLEGHQAFHSPLAAPVAEAARRELSDLRWSAPRQHVVDGRGVIFTPWSADPGEIGSYSLGYQLTEPFDFTRQLTVALRELAPEAVVLLGPGDAIGGAIGQVLVLERFFGLASKSDFTERQKTADPVLFSLGRPEQRARLLG